MLSAGWHNKNPVEFQKSSNKLNNILFRLDHVFNQIILVLPVATRRLPQLNQMGHISEMAKPVCCTQFVTSHDINIKYIKSYRFFASIS